MLTKLSGVTFDSNLRQTWIFQYRTQHCHQVGLVSSVKLSISQFLGKTFTEIQKFLRSIFLKDAKNHLEIGCSLLPKNAIFMLYIELFCFMVTRSTGNEIEYFFNISFFLIFLLSSTLFTCSLFIACVFLAHLLCTCIYSFFSVYL